MVAVEISGRGFGFAREDLAMQNTDEEDPLGGLLQTFGWWHAVGVVVVVVGRLAKMEGGRQEDSVIVSCDRPEYQSCILTVQHCVLKVWSPPE